jgi:hypothetical protein
VLCWCVVWCSADNHIITSALSQTALKTRTSPPTDNSAGLFKLENDF